MPQNDMTVKRGEEVEYFIQRSRFLANAFHVETRTQAEEILKAVRKKYHDATHRCYAYILGGSFPEKKFSDDGEPQGTAGLPILEVVERRGLIDTLVVVTRYFGGIKLGAGGLVRAYSTAASMAADRSEIVIKKICGFYSVKLDYSTYHKICGGLLKLSAAVTDYNYDDGVAFTAITEEDNFAEKLTDLCEGKCRVKKIKDSYFDFKM